MIDFDMDYIIQLHLAKKQADRDAKKKEEDPSIHDGYYSASQTGYCLRKQYLDLKEGNSSSMDGKRNMEMGDINLKYSTTQPISKLQNGQDKLWAF